MINIFGLQKLTLIDYPGKTAATVFLSGCDFNCPFCHNAALMNDNTKPLNDVNEVLEFLDSRKKLLDGVCISGGEPLLQPGVLEFCKEVKSLGIEIKLDTNGQNPELLKNLADNKLVDYIAMDIKSSLHNYSKAVGITDFDTSNIEESARFLLTGIIPYEFRTTVVEQLHTDDDFHSIGQWLKGAKNYFLQTFILSGDVPDKNLNAYSSYNMKRFCDILNSYRINANLREEG